MVTRRGFLGALGFAGLYGQGSSQGRGPVRPSAADGPDRPADDLPQRRTVALFDGQTLDGWTVEHTTSGFKVVDGLLRVEEPKGWLRSVEAFDDFSLRVEWRFVTENADSGIFFRAAGSPDQTFGRGWPANAYQVQVRDMSTNRTTNPYWIANLYRHGTPPGETSFDADAALAAAKGPGEWQSLDIVVAGEHVTAALNGVRVLSADGLANPKGHIGIQAETGVLEYRRFDLTTA